MLPLKRFVLKVSSEYLGDSVNPSQYTYLDYAASAPMRSCALQALNDYHAQACSVANANSLHTLGREAATYLTQARKDMAKAFGYHIRPQEVIFTGGGTEANNLAIFGIAEDVRSKDRTRSTIIMSAIEHDSVIDLAAPLKARGFTVKMLRPNKEGIITSDALASQIDESVCLVCVMAANNETGAIQPIDELGQLTHKHGGYFFTDAIQAFGRIPLNLEHVDAMSVAAHKIGGPQGIGALMIRRQVPYTPQEFGGGQELSRRPGTQDVAACVSFAAAATCVMQNLDKTRLEVESLANHAYEKLCAHPKVKPTTTPTATGKLPGIVHIMVKGLDAQTVLLKLDDKGFGVSSGSACASASLDPSHVLSAMGINSDWSFGAIRISFDERVSLAEIDAFIDAFYQIIPA